MSTSFGLKLTKSKDSKPNPLSRPSKPAPKAAPLSKGSIFGDHADDDSEDDDPTKSLNKKNAGGIQYGLQKSLSSSIPSKRSGPGSLDKSPSLSVSKDNPPEEEDPSIYDYDTAWDNMKAAENRRKATVEGDDRKPKYMNKLLEAAQVRERDRLRAKDRLLQKEREAEGEDFADKEKFVTGAYKKQQEEMKRLEEEEKKRQEEMDKKGGGISGFYRTMLDTTERQHEELVKATEKKDEPEFLMLRPEEEKSKRKSEAEVAAELNKKKAGAIDVNEEGQVVDKRQLLGAGLNVKPKASKPSEDPRNRQSRDSYSRPTNDYHANKSRKDMRERQSRMIEQQLEEATRKAERDEATDRSEIERQAKIRKTTTGDVNSARERYLQRKREAEEKKKAGG